MTHLTYGSLFNPYGHQMKLALYPLSISHLPSKDKLVEVPVETGHIFTDFEELPSESSVHPSYSAL